MNKVICPFCKQDLILTFDNSKQAIIIYDCVNHNIPVKLLFYKPSSTFFSIVIGKSHKLNLKILFFKNSMELYYNNLRLTLPMDNNLTPENFSNKLKTYLNFQ
jgi:hypothetical protein